MPILKYLKLFALSLPILEIAGFIIVGNLIGVIPTLLLVVISSLLGGALLRGHGFIELQQLQQRVREGFHPNISIMENALILFAGFLLLLPGFITDIIGLLLLSGRIRLWLLKWLSAKNLVIIDNNYKQNSAAKTNTIEGEFWHEDDKNQ